MRSRSLELTVPPAYSTDVDMAESALIKVAAVPGAVVSALALVWLVLICRLPPEVFGRFLVAIGTAGASGLLILCWSTPIGRVARTRGWLAQWSFLAGALPFWVLALCSLFIGRVGFARMMLVVFLGFFSGRVAGKKVHPELAAHNSP
jgi:hypothetical protein